MNLDIRAMTEAERKYSYTQSAQLSSQTGCIGYLCGDFGSGEKFSPNWFDQRREYQREAFRAEFNAVIQKLQDKAGCGLPGRVGRYEPVLQRSIPKVLFKGTTA